MEKYQKVQKPRLETPFNENEMRITSMGLLGNYVNYATSLFQERRGREIVLKGMGQAISKTVSIAEILKRRIPQLHQDTAIDSVSMVDVWEPIEEGLLPVETSHQVSAISITLSTEELNTNSPGKIRNSDIQQSASRKLYQAPAYLEQSRPRQNYQQQRSHQPPRQARTRYNVVSEDAYGHGRVRGRGRGRGWNRGGYRNYEGNYRGNYQGGYQGNYHGGYQGNYQGGYQGNYPGGYLGNYPGSYQGNYQENGGYANRSQGAARGPRVGGYGYRGTGYGKGRGRGGGRGHGHSI